MVDESSTGPELTMRIPSPEYVATKPVRDEKLYFSSGDCILQVDGTLFKVSWERALQCPAISAQLPSDS
jgi:hypothetical protein